jgi:glucuronoarabinoxylan endo-1,4-beta-xylanase
VPSQESIQNVVIMTNGSKLIALIILLSLTTVAKAQTATVTWTNTHQTMDGFGAQTWLCCNSLSAANADMFFSPTAGIGLEYVRTANTSDGSIPDLLTLQEAVARGAKVELSLQSPPASMKVSGSFNEGTGGINTADYGAYATYVVNYIQNLQSNGVPVDVLSVQNEPDISFSSLGASIWTAQQFDTFVGSYLGPAMASAGLKTKIMLGEASGWFDDDLVSTSLNDSKAASYISLVAGHGYGTGSLDGTGTGYCCHTATPYPLATSAGKHLWQSEVNGGFTYNSSTSLWNWDPSMADALLWAHSIHDYMTAAEASGWEYWELADCCGGMNDGLTDASFNPSKRMYVVGNFSKFIRSGYVRIDATASPESGIYVSAYKNPSTGDFAIVAINENGSETPLSVSLSGFSTGSVTPWVTSSSLNLAQQQSITISGSSFNATLSASSVTTFVATAGAAGAPTPPTITGIVIN